MSNDKPLARLRLTQRRVCVFDNLNNISTDWVGLKSIIQVERVGTRASKPYQQTAYTNFI